MLYHKCVYWKPNFNRDALRMLNDNYSIHLLENLLFSKRDNHSINIHRLNCIIRDIKDINNNTQQFYIYEVEEDDRTGEVVKAVLRTRYNEKDDISIVFCKDCVITVWLNHHNDRHNTLDKRRYYNGKCNVS